jgi:hypothetical protein
MKTKGLTCSILEPKDIGNCSNYGISSKCESVTLLGILRLDGSFEQAADIFEPTELSPGVIIEERRPCGKLYYSAFPCDNNGEKLPGWFMAGGCFIKTSDSRFPFDYPVPLHDRQE